MKNKFYLVYALEGEKEKMTSPHRDVYGEFHRKIFQRILRSKSGNRKSREIDIFFHLFCKEIGKLFVKRDEPRWSSAHLMAFHARSPRHEELLGLALPVVTLEIFGATESAKNFRVF